MIDKDMNDGKFGGATSRLSENVRPVIGTKAATLHIMKAFNLRAGKRLGQNFLIEPAVVNAAVDAASITEGDNVLEIGPGIGTLTQGLLEQKACVTAVEADKKLPAVLAETLAGYDNFRLITGDIMKIDIAAAMNRQPFKVAANLPYYITTPILLKLLMSGLPVTDIVVMVQKEVAERMVADETSEAYGSLSVAVRYFSSPRIVREVGARCFFPPPKVESALVYLRCFAKDPAGENSRGFKLPLDEKLFFRVVRASFGQRRKTLTNALKSGGFAAEILRRALAQAGIDGGRRGETLSIAEFVAVSDAIYELQ